MSVAPSVAPLLIGSLFYGKFRKCEKCRWLSRWLPCSLALYFIENVENVKNIGAAFGRYLAHWLSVLLKIWKMLKVSVASSVVHLFIGSLFYGKCKKMWKISLAPSVAPLLIGCLFYGKCEKCENYQWLPRWLPCSLAICYIENVENVKNVGGSLGGSLAHWFSVLWEM